MNQPIESNCRLRRFKQGRAPETPSDTGSSPGGAACRISTQRPGSSPAGKDAGGGSPGVPGGDPEIYRSVVGELREFIIRWLPDGTCTFANESWCRYVGRSGGEVLGSSFLALIPAADREIIRREIRSLTPESPWAVVREHRSIAADGAVCWQEWAHHGRFGENGRLAEVQSVGRDITECKRVEEALRASEGRFRDLFQKAPGLLHSTDTAGRLLNISQGWLDKLGYERNEIIGRPTFDLLTEASRRHAEEVLMPDFIESGSMRDEALQIQTKSGEVLDILVSGTFERDEEGEPSHSITFCVDVTERNRAEAALRDSEARYRAVFESSLDALIIMRLKDRRTIAVNPALARLFGRRPAEIMSQGLATCLDDGSRAVLAEALEMVERGRERHFSLKVPRKDGREIDFSGYFTPFAYKGERHALGVGRDVTAQRRAEREKQQAFEEVARLKQELERERDYLREEIDEPFHFGEIVGRSPALKRVLLQTEAVASTSANVLIQGESGVGKELIARAIHARSLRRSRPLVRVNCASIPRDLFESEFFGHAKGSFTGAHRDRVGRFELADHGTLFLDEVSEIPADLQVKLLRVLQEGEYERVGDETTRKSDVRIIAATNRELKAEVRAGRFREDLFYRLSVFPIEVPPLRERRQDVLPLAVDFLRMACRDLGRPPLAITQTQAAALREHDWPGNARELRNVIERAVILSRGDRLRLEDALTDIGSSRERREEGAGDRGAGRAFVTEAEMRRRERENILAALREAGWRISGKGGAADLLGLKATTLAYRMRVMGIARPA